MHTRHGEKLFAPTTPTRLKLANFSHTTDRPEHGYPSSSSLDNPHDIKAFPGVRFAPPACEVWGNAFTCVCHSVYKGGRYGTQGRCGIEGCLPGGVCPPPPPPRYGKPAGGTHPTRMHTCYS